MESRGADGCKTDPDYTVRSNFHTPPSQFDGCFTTFYHLSLKVEDGGIVEDFLQPEWSNIRFFGGALPQAEIADAKVSDARFGATGPSSRPCHFKLGSCQMWGIGFLPLGWARFIGADAHDLANTLWDGSKHPAFEKFNVLTDVMCDPQANRDEQLAFLTNTLENLMQSNRDEPKILRVHKALVDGSIVAVKELAEECGMSVRTLERVCCRYFGFTPKLLMRRQRFTRSLASYMLHEGSRWTEAMDADYHDQAQFTREFNEFMTMNPSEYAALDHPILSSFMEARARVWGSASQALDRP